MKAVRELRGPLSQEAFARRLDITTRTEARWEREDILSPQALVLLAKFALKEAPGLAASFLRELKKNLGLDEPLLRLLRALPDADEPSPYKGRGRPKFSDRPNVMPRETKGRT